MLVDDHVMFAESLARILGDHADIEVVANVATAREARDAVAGARPDVVILDYQLPDSDGAALARDLRLLTTARFVMATGHGTGAVVRESIAVGCTAVIAKERAARELVQVVRDAAASASPPNAVLIDTALKPPRSDLGGVLSRREFDVLRLLDAGRSTEEIAATLYVSRNTVRSHVQRILQKLGARSKLEAVARARRDGLL